MNKIFDYTLEPGLNLSKLDYEFGSPTISIIVPFYNDKMYIEQTIYSLLNQTYPCFEILIIDDGSTDKESLEKLDDILKLDKRIKVYHKENGGLASTRDYGALKATKSTKYFCFIDSDDLIEKTFLECGYFTLETNKDASWTYGDSVGFDKIQYLWNKWFDSKKIKKVNELVSCCLVRKEDYCLVNGYELREKAVNEDWNFWLKLIAKGKYPVHMSFYAQWYRRKNSGELSKSIQNRKRALEIVNNTAKTIKKDVQAIQYPLFAYKNEKILEDLCDSKSIPLRKNKVKKSILMFVPWMVTGGADIFNLELIKRLHEDYNFIMVSTIPNVNLFRQEMEKYATIYDLTSFLDRKYWLGFINYLVVKEKIDIFFCTNSMFGYSIMPYLKLKYKNIPIIDYVHMEEWYYRDGGFARMSSNYKDFIDKTLVCNKRTENVLVDKLFKEKKDVSTIYIGVDVDKFDPKIKDIETCKQELGIPNDKFVISYICRIAEQKRPLLLFEIMKSTIAARKDVCFVIAGDGDMLDTLKKKVEQESISSYVYFLGNVSNTYDVYRASDITINCSIKEGLALTAYESLAMGVPVISADVGGQRELIDSKVGRIVPCLQEETDIKNYNYSLSEINSYVKAIDEVIKELPKLKKNCRAKILDKFTLAQMAENMKNEFDKLCLVKPKVKKIELDNALKYIQDEFNYDIDSSIYLVQEYQRKVYGYIHTDREGNNISSYRQELLKEKLWQSKTWQKIVKSKGWKRLKKMVKR